MSESKPLSLSEALESERLQEFIDQQEARGTGPITAAEFDETAATIIKTPPQSGQTSRSPRRGGSREK